MHMQKRNGAIDAAKGLGILFVIVGHVMSPVMGDNGVLNMMYTLMYTFHMPLFFFLSGLTSRKLIGGRHFVDKLLLMRQKAKRLLIPYYAWAIIYTPMKWLMRDAVRFQYEYSPWTLLVGNNPDGQLWFLYVLFMLSVIAIWLINERNIRYWVVFGVMISFVAPIIPKTIAFPGISLSFSLYQVGFYMLGIWLAPRCEALFHKYSWGWVSLAVFVMYSILQGIFGDSVWFLKGIAALAAIEALMVLGNRISRSNMDFIKKLGKMSMEIYMLHAPILVVGRSILIPLLSHKPGIYIVVLSSIALGISIFGTLIIRKTKYIRQILFGG